MVAKESGSPTMTSRPIKTIRRRRFIAAATLFVWVAALLSCTTHCAGISFGSHDNEPGQPSCHASGKTDRHSEEPSTPCKESSFGWSCLTLKSALVDGKVPILTQPDLPLLYTSAPFLVVLRTALGDGASVVFRQAQRRDWVFTPEVCLGPAFQSLAPPSSSPA